MNIDENKFSDEIIMGSPKVINDITFIPIIDVSFGCFKSFGFFFGGHIYPKAFITINKDGSYGFFKLSDDNPEDILKSIS